MLSFAGRSGSARRSYPIRSASRKAIARAKPEVASNCARCTLRSETKVVTESWRSERFTPREREQQWPSHSSLSGCNTLQPSRARSPRKDTRYVARSLAVVPATGAEHFAIREGRLTILADALEMIPSRAVSSESMSLSLGVQTGSGSPCRRGSRFKDHHIDTTLYLTYQ